MERCEDSVGMELVFGGILGADPCRFERSKEIGDGVWCMESENCIGISSDAGTCRYMWFLSCLPLEIENL